MNFAYFWPDTGWIKAKDADQLYAKLVEQAVFADELGYDQVWIAEHDIVDYIAVPDPFQSALLIAERPEHLV